MLTDAEIEVELEKRGWKRYGHGYWYNGCSDSGRPLLTAADASARLRLEEMPYDEWLAKIKELGKDFDTNNAEHLRLCKELFNRRICPTRLLWKDEEREIVKKIHRALEEAGLLEFRE